MGQETRALAQNLYFPEGICPLNLTPVHRMLGIYCPGIRQIFMLRRKRMWQAQDLGIPENEGEERALCLFWEGGRVEWEAGCKINPYL